MFMSTVFGQRIRDELNERLEKAFRAPMWQKRSHPGAFLAYFAPGWFFPDHQGAVVTVRYKSLRIILIVRKNVKFAMFIPGNL